MSRGIESTIRMIKTRQILMDKFDTASVINDVVNVTGFSYAHVKDNIDSLMGEKLIFRHDEKIWHSGRQRWVYETKVKRHQYRPDELKELEARIADELPVEPEEVKSKLPNGRIVSFSGSDPASRSLKRNLDEAQRQRVRERKAPKVYPGTTAAMV